MEIPKKIFATGTHFYKYSSLEFPERLKGILLDHELYLPSPPELNDPADGRPQLAPLTEEKMFDFLHNANRNPTLTPAAQQKLLGTLAHSIRSLGPETLMRKMDRLLNDLFKSHGIYSLSKRYDNMLLWGTYAAGHKGYCLEFANEGNLFKYPLEVIYGDAFPMDVTNPEHRKAYFFYCKRKIWSHEEEVRLLFLDGGGRKFKFDPHCLTRIILGWKMPEDHEKMIREWAKQREPELVVVKAYFDELDYKLKLRG